MKIDRKKIVNRCGYDQNECMFLAKRLSTCPDNELIAELKQITVWNYGKCELGLWADVLDRLDTILENAVTKEGKWMLRLDTPQNSSLVDDVVTVLEFTGHLIEHSIYRYLYGSWNHILALFGSSDMDVLLAVLGLSYNFSKRSNYFIRLDQPNKKMIFDRLVSIAETWGGSENGFGLASCCDPSHFPETAGNVYFEYRSEKGSHEFSTSQGDASHTSRSSSHTTGKIILQALHKRNQSPSEIMEEILSQHDVPHAQRMALFARIRLATYFADPEQRHKCIRARLQALSILSYTFEVDERHLYPSLLDELVEVLMLPEGQYMGIKACALRTMTAIVNSQRVGVNWSHLVGFIGLSSYHGILPNLTRKWLDGIASGSIKAPSGSVNQQFTTALLSFLYHLACFEENFQPAHAQHTPLSSSGILDTMLEFIAWHTPHNDYLSYATRAVRVTDQILMSLSSSNQNVVDILVDRLNYEVDIVLRNPSDSKAASSSSSNTSFMESNSALNTQRSGLLKSILNLLKRLCLDTEWWEVMHKVIDNQLPFVLRRIFLNGSTHFTPHLSLFAMETITNYLYTHPSRISSIQDRQITADILKALTDQPLPQNREFLVQMPAMLNALSLNSRGTESILSSGVISRYLDTLISPEYLPTMKTKRVRDFLSQISYNLSYNSGQNMSNSLTASQMSNSMQELLRSRSELKSPVFKCLVACFRKVVQLGNSQPAVLVSKQSLLESTSFEFVPSSIHDATSSSVDLDSQSIHIIQSSSSGVRRQSDPLGTVDIRSIRPSVGPLDDDVVMLSGGEEEDDDDNEIDYMTRTSRVVSETPIHHASSDSVSTTFPRIQTSDVQMNSPSTDRCSKESSNVFSSAPPHLFLPDFILNLCKFLEKLLPSVVHMTETMCRHFTSHGGLQVLCDLLRMPGLPYDFPVSAACASLCKIFEDLANSINPNDIIQPLFQCLETSLEKLLPLHNSTYPMGSLLLREYVAGEHLLLHELVVTASVICILVQIIDHIKPELRFVLVNKWIWRKFLTSLGRLYLGVSWEAAIILKILLGDEDISDTDMFGTVTPSTEPPQLSTPETTNPSSKSTTKSNDPMPQFVEAMHIYTILKQFSASQTSSQTGFIHRHPELVKPLNKILHVTAFLINSVTELCTSWNRFFANRNQVNHRRRRLSLVANEQISSDAKNAILTGVSHVLYTAMTWQPSTQILGHKATPNLVYAIRYASIRLTNLLLHDTASKSSDTGMINAFATLNGIRLYFNLFKELMNFDVTNPSARELLVQVLEEWLVCADRISSTEYQPSSSLENRRTTESDPSLMDAEKFSECVHQSMLFPLAQLCVRKYLQNLLTRRGVEHLLSMLVTIVPYLFDTDKKLVSTNKKKPTGSVKPVPTGTQPSSESLEHGVEETHGHTSREPLNEAGDIAASDASLSANQETATTTADNPTPMSALLERSTDGSTTPVPVSESSIHSQNSNVSLSRPDIDISSMISESDADQLSQMRNLVLDMNAVLLMVEMGFSPLQSLVALQQTGWDTNEAVILAVNTPVESLLASATTSSLSQPSAVPQHRRGEQQLDQQLTDASSDDIRTITSQSNPTASNSNNPITTPAMSDLSNALQSSVRSPGPKFPLLELEPLSQEAINGLRESLKQNVFRTCYAIAKRHHSDQILHQIAELFISSGEEERYLDELFAVVKSNLESNAFTATSGFSKPSAQNEDPVKELQTVGLHLLALLFTRCQFLCARLAATHGLPDLLVDLICNSNLLIKLSKKPSTFADQIECSDNVSLYPDYHRILTLAALILDQYERSIQAMILRQQVVKLYSTSHSWYWFDDHAMLWLPYSNDCTRTINESFLKGDLCSHCTINRRPYTIEFPTMTQVNIDSNRRRPVLLMPNISDSSDTKESELCSSETPDIKNSGHESETVEIPPCLSSKQRSALLTAILSHFRSARTAAKENDLVSNYSNLLPSDCVNAMLRLLLRLCYSKYEDANEIAQSDFLTILLNYPHSRDFSSEYSNFVGALLSQVFEDASLVDRVMRGILKRMTQYGVPSVFLGVNASPNGVRDLFYLLTVCAPLFAKDRERALRLACEIFSLTLPETDVQNKFLSKLYTVDRVSQLPEDDQSNFTLSTYQKNLITLLLDSIMSPSSRNLQPSQTVSVAMSCIEDMDIRTDNDTFTSMATGIPTTSTTLSPASSTTTSTWMSGATICQSAGLISYQDQNVCSSSSSSKTQPTVRTCTTANNEPKDLVVLGKLYMMHYVISLVSAYKPVAEFVTLYKHKQTSDQMKSESDIHTGCSSFLSHLFNNQLCDPNTEEITISLLENLILMSCESTQAIIIREFKASLGHIAGQHISTGIAEQNDNGNPQVSQNKRIVSHMLFLSHLLALPTQLISRIVHFILKCRIPADIAKLIALVDYSAPNIQSTITCMLGTLNRLILLSSHFNKLNHAHNQRSGQSAPFMRDHSASSLNRRTRDAAPLTSTSARSSVTISASSNSHMRQTGTGNVEDASQLMSGVLGSGGNADVGGADGSTRLVNRDFDSDSDDDDDEDNDVGMLDEQNFPHNVMRASDSAFDSRNLVLPVSQEANSSSALGIVLNDVIVAQADMVISTGHRNENVPESWHTVTGTEQDGGSVIFVHDDEDDGSAGQGGEGDNSQDEDDILGVDEEEDDEDDDQDDVEDDVEDDEDVHDPDDGEEVEDVDVSGEDEEVAFVLSRGHRHRSSRLGRSGLLNARRRRADTSITISVSDNRDGNDRVSAGEAHVDEIIRVDDDIVLHDDGHGEDDGSSEDEDIDNYDREDDDDEREEVAILTSDNGRLILGPENRLLRGNNSVVDMVEEVLNLADVPQLNVLSNVRINRRERLPVFSDYVSSSLNGRQGLQSVYPSGNWGLLYPRWTRPISGENSLRGTSSAGVGIPSTTNIYRFGLGEGSSTSVLLTGGNTGRMGSSALNIINSGSGFGGSGSSHGTIVASSLLPNQHPLLQIPSTSTSQGSAVNSGVISGTTPGSNPIRLNSSVISNTTSNPSSNRAFSVLPAISQLSFSISGMHNNRNRNGVFVALPADATGTPFGQHGIMSRIFGFPPNSHSDADPNSRFSTTRSSNVQRCTTSSVSSNRDSRSGPEADVLVWTMLASLAEDQPTSLNSALAAAVFGTLNQAQTTVSHAPSNSVLNDSTLSPSQLAPYAGYALPPSFKHWIYLCRMLFGHEIMDFILLSRYQVFKELEEVRKRIFDQRLAETHYETTSSSTVPPAHTTDNESPSEAVAMAQVTNLTPSVLPEPGGDTPVIPIIATDVPVSTASGAQQVSIPDPTLSEPESVTMVSPNQLNSDLVSGVVVSSETTTITNIPTTISSPVILPTPVPMTDEETIQSLVESGMDPSFLDALPDDMRREVIADHRHARQVQQQLNAMQLPEHINSEWLAELPPHIQDEVLAQFRHEQQQHQESLRASASTTAGATASTSSIQDVTAGDASAQRSTTATTTTTNTTTTTTTGATAAPESNTAFLSSLPPSLRREVLADMEESQLEMLPPELAVEARQLRRENEERYAREVQSVSCRNFTPYGLIGGHGRWDVRFNSINQFLRNPSNFRSSASLNNSSAVMGLLWTMHGRRLVDYEGLTCLIVLLISSSSSCHERRITTPIVPWVLRNLCCHVGTRNWVVHTLLSLFNGLSEKPLPSSNTSGLTSPNLPPDSQPSTGANLSSSLTSHQETLPPGTDLTLSSNNSIFHTGFEAALGCWVRVFHPIDQSTYDSSKQLSSSTESAKGCPHHASGNRISYIIHPQASVAVANIILETFLVLTQMFPMHFQPLPPSKSTQSEPDQKLSLSTYHDSQSSNLPSTSFWEIFNRLSHSPPNFDQSTSSMARSSLRRPRASYKRPCSTSEKQTGDSLQTSPSITATTADVPLAGQTCSDIGSKRDTADTSSHSEHVKPQSSTNSFAALAILLCHPILRDRPMLQERLLNILSGILNYFLTSRSFIVPNPPTQPPRTYSQVLASNTPREALVETQPDVQVADLETLLPTDQEMQGNLSAPNCLMQPLASEVVETLCQLVLASKTTELGRKKAILLIIDLAYANQTTKELVLNLLSLSANELIKKLTDQLTELIKEINSRSPDKRTSPNSTITAPSTSSRFISGVSRVSSYDVIPDRFGTSDQVVVVSGDPRPSSIVKFSDAQLLSAEPFSSPNNDQCKLRGVIGLMLRLIAGSNSVNGAQPIPATAQETFQNVPGLTEFWCEFSKAFDKLQSLPDTNAILLLQPLLEAFCLAHIYLVKDSVLIRQGPNNASSNRTTSTNPSSGNLTDMVPVLLMSVDQLSSSEPEGGASATDHLAHLHFDLGGPCSPPVASADKSDETCGRSSASSTNAPYNPILQFAEQHRNGLNQILRHHGSSLGNSPFAIFLSYPRVLDFDIKRRFFKQQLQLLSNRSPQTNRYDDEPITISRDRIFEDSYARLHRRSASEWKNKFVIRFQNEEGQDAGGPLREWYLLMSREIFNPNYCLFRVSPADRVTYTISPSSYINSNHLSYFKFVGRFIAKAIFDNKLLECYFTRAFYKHILGVPVKCSDLESEDYDFFKGLEFLLNNHVSDLGYELTFSTEINEFGKTESRDLIENGRNVTVTEQNKREYVRLVCQERMTGAIRQQLHAFLSGFYEIIPKKLISIFNEQELELLISGLPNIDIADLKANTTYSKYQPNSPQIEWFWRALESFEQEDLARFLQFVTGTSKVPLGGFANLEGMHGPTKLQISRAATSSTNHLPSAHTCFNTLVLPAYENYNQLRSRLLLAIRECSEGYGMA